MTDGDTPIDPIHLLTAKERMAIERVTMPEQDPDARAVNFREVNLGLTQQIAMLEAERCLQCPKPYCVGGCPVSVNIPRFLKLLREGDLPGAADSLLDDNALPCVTGCSRRYAMSKKVGFGSNYLALRNWTGIMTTSSARRLARSKT